MLHEHPPTPGPAPHTLLPEDIEPININAVLPGIHDPRDLPDAPPIIGSDLMANVGGKPRRQIPEHRGPYSDWAFQAGFAAVPQPKPRGEYMFGDYSREDTRDGEWITPERQVARFVLHYLNRGEVESNLDADQLESTLLGIQKEDLTSKQRKAVQKFDRALSKAATNLNTVSQVRAGRGPKVIKKPSDTVVPPAVQQRVQILPQDLGDRRVVNKAAALETVRMHGRVTASRTTSSRNPHHPQLKKDFFDARGDRKREEKHDWANHHEHHANDKLVKLAYKPAKRLARQADKLHRVMGQ